MLPARRPKASQTRETETRQPVRARGNPEAGNKAEYPLGAMHNNARYPKRPVRAAFIAFVVLAAFVGAFILFDESIRRVWPFAFGYCALLAVGSIGLARLSRRVLLLLAVSAVVALAPGVVGLALALRSGASVESGSAWLQSSLYLFYALAVWGVYWVIRGWSLYFTRSHEAT
jgi:hypothetical protein